MRIGLLGTGPWAGITHAPALAAHPGVEFTGIWGRRPEAAAALAAEHGTRAYADVDDLIADVDAIAVALPPDVQAPLAVRAAEAGRHLLLDKPVATNVDDARRVAEAAEAAGVASVVFFTLRFAAPSAAWIDERSTEDGWFVARAEWLGSVFTSGDSPFADSPWRREKGALWDVGPHALSVLLPVLGDVTGITSGRGPGDTVHLVLRHASGASSTATLSLTTPPEAAGMTVEFRGTHGVAVLPERGDGPVAAFSNAVDALLTAVETGVAHPCDARFGFRVTELLASV
ncbi:Gfo/Idh/MocA family protein [Streptomyces sp. NPDC058691]|uniref:Gfo/Idh/MocA family protein n=1 Tax=Streptomyces sp. NPDC058691 TaxID=3346601 RepID=UPI0036576EAE